MQLTIMHTIERLLDKKDELWSYVDDLPQFLPSYRDDLESYPKIIQERC